MLQRQHVSVAMPAVQDRRARKIVPGGRRLHGYANLYICARNPMMFVRRRLEKAAMSSCQEWDSRHIP